MEMASATRLAPLKRGEDPFGVLQAALTKSNAGVSEKAAMLRRQIMAQKHELNALVVSRRKLEARVATRKGRTEHCARTMALTTKMLRGLNGEDGNDDGEGGGIGGARRRGKVRSRRDPKAVETRLRKRTLDLLQAHRMGAFLTQVVRVCTACTGNGDTAAEAEAQAVLAKLDRQILEGERALSILRDDNKTRERTILPQYRHKLSRYRKLKAATLSEMQRGADVLVSGTG